MCTVVILRRPDEPWPLLLAANRDEMLARPSRPPGRHWSDRPNVIAGLDELAGGSWLGLNDEGVLAAVMNRRGSLGPADGMRSRGELVLEALDHADARDAAEALSALDAQSYRAFNLIVADNQDAYWLKGLGPDGPKTVEAFSVPAGLSMITASDRNDRTSARIRTYLPKFEAATVPDPERGEWSAWESLLRCRAHAPGTAAEDAMTIVTDYGFGTVSRSLIAVPGTGVRDRRPVWRYADGQQDPPQYIAIAG
ncbi:MAG: NRDE family protein [Alphaproteobacteria bacterium]